MECKYPDQTAGEAVATKIKRYYFDSIPWSPILAMQVGYKMATLVKLTRKYYPTYDSIGLLHKLGTYSKQDMDEVFELTTDKDVRSCSDHVNRQSGICEPLEHSTGSN